MKGSVTPQTLVLMEQFYKQRTNTVQDFINLLGYLASLLRK